MPRWRVSTGSAAVALKSRGAKYPGGTGGAGGHFLAGEREQRSHHELGTARFLGELGDDRPRPCLAFRDLAADHRDRDEDEGRDGADREHARQHGKLHAPSIAGRMAPLWREMANFRRSIAGHATVTLQFYSAQAPP
jgi:hypothetical protein